ncbi:hypothetical protein GCM10022235_30240 [Kribbella ginsengisoli]|uniref:Uncharacterized protein n=1 Tax=Kribbella ginsengisoli TaxID=363865 RepID=A0ABP6X2R2_9ACTN
MTTDWSSGGHLPDVPVPGYYSVQLWLGDHLVEEHIAPAELAQEFANVIQLRIAGLPGRRLRCFPAGPPASSA